MIYPTQTQTVKAVARHYDDLDSSYRLLWGHHLHHGYWVDGRETQQKAVENLIELVAEKSRLRKGERVVDIGCGYGGTVHYLGEIYGAVVTGLTVSQSQYYAANEQLPLTGRSQILLQDWLQNDLEADSFDVAISLETSAHMESKERFFHQIARVLKPGGRAVVCAWLVSKDFRPWHRRRLLEPICEEGRFPSMGCAQEYFEFIEEAGLKMTEYVDISRSVRKTWTLVGRTLLMAIFTKKEIRQILLDNAQTNRIFAKTVFRILFAYRLGCLRYGVFTLEKPFGN